MPPQVRIKRVSFDRHQDTIRSLHDDCFGSSAPAPDPDGWWWLAWSGAEPVGFAQLTPSKTLHGWGYLARVGVLPWHRGKGIGGRLVQVRERFARRLGYEGLRTDTYSFDNASSSNVLARLGYEIYNPKRPWAFKHSLYWRKWL